MSLHPRAMSRNWTVVQRGRGTDRGFSSFVHEENLPDVIALQGENGCGKSTVGSYLCEFYGYVRESFAYSLKQIAHVCFGFPEVCLYGTDAEKNLVNVHVNESGRKVLQILGTEGFRHSLKKLLPTLKIEEGMTFWAWRMRQVLQKHIADGKRIVIDDCRFPDEVAMLKNMQTNTNTIVPDGISCSIWQVFRESAQATKTNGGDGAFSLAHQRPVLSDDVIEDEHVSEICVRILFPFQEHYMQMERRNEIDPALGISFSMAEKAFLIIINDILLGEHLPHMLFGLTMREWRWRIINGVSFPSVMHQVPFVTVESVKHNMEVVQSQAPVSHASNNPTALYHDVKIFNDSDKAHLFSKIDTILNPKSQK